MILSIDTTAGTSAAVVHEGKVLGYSVFDDPYGHAENVGRAIENALQQASVQAEQIQRVAISRGPASYTGLRVGMATGLAFAIGRQVPLHGVISLDAVALFHASETQHSAWIVTSDAKRGELFVGAYAGFSPEGLPIREQQPEVMKPEQLEQSYADMVRIGEPCDAKAVGLYAEMAIAAGLELEDVSALYLRSPDVTPSTGKRVSG